MSKEKQEVTHGTYHFITKHERPYRRLFFSRIGLIFCWSIASLACLSFLPEWVAMIQILTSSAVALALALLSWGPLRRLFIKRNKQFYGDNELWRAMNLADLVSFSVAYSFIGFAVAICLFLIPSVFCVLGGLFMSLLSPMLIVSGKLANDHNLDLVRKWEADGVLNVLPPIKLTNPFKGNGT